MNRKIPVQHADPVRLVGLQTLLIGLEATLDRHVSDINDVRDQLGHPRIGVLRNALPPQSQEEPLPYRQPDVPERPVRQLAIAPQQSGPQRTAHKSLGKKVAAFWKSKRAILEAAGMNRGVRGMPSHKLMAKAVRKLERLGIPVPGQDNQPTLVRQAPKSKTKTPPKAPKKTGRSKRMKKQISVSSTSRWALAHEAGLHPTTIPDKKMLEKARRIIAARKEGVRAARQAKSSKAVKAAVADMEQTQARESAPLSQEVV